MAERKVLVKYYPPDFDADLLYKNKRSRDKQDNVRMMLPMSLQCITCGVYLYIGSKFNMRKETVLDEDYLGLQVFRFYLKCYACYSEITFKTDPKNHDYIVEGGGRRNYEPWRDINAAQEKMQQLKTIEEQGNTMKFLENKTFDSKREMDILDALDEIRNANKRNANVTVDDLFLHFYTNQTTNLNDQNVEQLYTQIAQKVFSKKTRIQNESNQQSNTNNIKETKNENNQNTYSDTINVFSNQNNKKLQQKNSSRINFKIKKIEQKQDQIDQKQENISNQQKNTQKKQLVIDYSSEDNN